MQKKTKDYGQNECNKKREDSIEADGLRKTPLNPISSLPTLNCLSAMWHMKDNGQGYLFFCKSR